MSLPTFNKDMNIIGGLADDPALSSTEFKAKFDEGGKAIQEFLNGTGAYAENGLIDAIVAEIISRVTTALTTAKAYTDTEVGELEDGQVTTNKNNITSLQTTVAGHTTSIASLNTQIAGALKYSDFVETETGTLTIDHGHGGVVTGGTALLKAGYYPLAISGYEIHCYNDGSSSGSAMYGEQPNGLIRCYIGERSSGRAAIYYSVQNRDNSQWTYRSTLNVKVLWVKI